MAIIHAADLKPTKAEAIAGWLPGQPWAAIGDIELVAAFRFDDPNGQVGLETHLVHVGPQLLQVPLTYRAAPLPGAEEALVCEMEHSVLGRRWVYDGCADPVMLGMLAATALTGVGQAAAIHVRNEDWLVAPPAVRLQGGGWVGDPLTVSGFGAPQQDGDWTVIRNADLEVRLARRPRPATSAPGLMATWPGQEAPVLLATVQVTKV